MFKPDEFAFSRENTIFTRVRPDFHLYDLVSDRESIYTFYAFRQRTDLDYIPLQLNEPVIGYAEPGQNTFYRYFIVSATGSYTISLDAKVGSPELLVRVGGDDPMKPTSKTEGGSGYDYNSNPVTIDQKMRSTAEFTCLQEESTYFNNGRTDCVFYIGVECHTAKCVYELKMDLTEESKNAEIPAPGYLLDQEYQRGSVNKGQVNYYYFPLERISET